MSKYFIAATVHGKSKITLTEVSCDTFNEAIQLADTAWGDESLTVKLNSLGDVVATIDTYIPDTITKIRKVINYDILEAV